MMAKRTTTDKQRFARGFQFPLMRNLYVVVLFLSLCRIGCGFVNHRPLLTMERTQRASHNVLGMAAPRANRRGRSQGQQRRRNHNNDDDDYDEPHERYLATCIPGMSSILAQELHELGVDRVETSGNAAVVFEGSVEVGLRSLLWLRTAHRLMQHIASADDIQSRDDLYGFVRSSTNVKKLLGNGRGGLLTLSVHVTLNQKFKIPQDINHSHFTALTVKNALCDAVRDMRGDRPSVDTHNADVPLVAILRGRDGGQGAQVSLYKCLHPPGSLHKRGYRSGDAIHKAAMKESMAAGLLLAAGYHRRRRQSPVTLVDPMAGSGSLVLEAAMMATDLAPGLMRIKCGVPGHNLPPAVRWRSNDHVDVVALWKSLLVDATAQAKRGMKQNSVRILANDIHPGALDICQSSLQRAGLDRFVEVFEGDCGGWEMDDNGDESPPVLVVTNPPWGERLTEDMHDSWEALRAFLRDRCPPRTEAWVLSGNKEATKHLGLKRSNSFPLQTAQQQLRWIQYKINDDPRSSPSIELNEGGEHKQRPSYSSSHELKDEGEGDRRPSYTSHELNKEEEGHQWRSSSSSELSDDDEEGEWERYEEKAPGRKDSRYTKDRLEDSKWERAPMTQQERDDQKNSWMI